MIRFACPSCRSVFEHSTAGHKLACPRCGQRIEVPPPPPGKTVLGEALVPGAPPQAVVPVTLVPAPGLSGTAKAILFSAMGILALLLAVLLIVLLRGNGSSTFSQFAGSGTAPSAEKEGLSQSTPEFAEYVKSRGVKVVIGMPGQMMGLARADQSLEPGRTLPRMVAVLAMPTARDAKDYASQYGEQGFAWGRFAVFVPPRADEGDPELFLEIRKALR